MSAPLIEIEGVSKRFPGVLALERINLTVARGACHGLVGENGAGKSTLGKILAGIYTADAGTLKIDGRPVSFHGPRDAMQAGVGMVHQELLFCENLSVAENLALGRTPRCGPFVARRRMRQAAARALEAIGATIDPAETVGALSVGRQQLVQIAAAVSRGARMLIFDEPTSSLSQYEAEHLFALIRRLRSQGVTIVYVSHRMEEIFQLCDTITVLRDGRHVDTRPAAGLTEDTLVALMIGRSIEAYYPQHLDTAAGAECLRVENLTLPGHFRNVSFRLHAGEVVGFAGLVGAGRTELAEAIFGLRRPTAGHIAVRGRRTPLRTPREAMAHGLGLVPEDRKRHGLVLSMNARENISLPLLARISRWGWIDRAAERKLTRRYFDQLRVRAPGLDTASAGLSGGNQQKLVIARWLAAECGVLLLDEPTRGVDVGAKAEIHGLIDDLARRGVAVLLISSELPELLNLSTRIIVLREGRLVGELTRAEACQESLMRLMSGIAPTP